MQNLIEYLKSHGVKITAPRRKILTNLLDEKSPLTLNEIFERTDKVDFASIYRNIKLFCELNLVREINMGDKKTRYELNIANHSHHIICSKCGEIEKLDVCFLSKIKKITKYKITEHHMEFVGICPECKQ